MSIRGEHIFFVGIKGVAMTNLAHLAKALGAHVCGSDVGESFITDDSLRDAHIPVHIGFEPTTIPAKTTLLIYAAGHGGMKNPQIVWAKKKGIRILHQASFLSILLEHFRESIAVAGCHGKTTTSGLLAFALKSLNHESSHMIGVSSCGEMPGGYLGGTDLFVFEADEYGMDPPNDVTPKFHLVSPDRAIITSIDHDHPDVYPTIDSVIRAYDIFCRSLIDKKTHIKGPRLIVCGDDPHIADLMFRFESDDFLSYGMSPSSDVLYRAISYEENETRFIVRSSLFDVPDTEIILSLFGEKNVANATGVIAMLLSLGYSIEKIRTALRHYTGPKRRMEEIFVTRGVCLFDDYAHHPAEIEATISAIHQRFPNRKLLVIFQPHTYSRTDAFLPDFAEALAKADHAIVLPVFASARETLSINSSKQTIARYAKTRNISHIEEVQNTLELSNMLRKKIRSGDVIMTMGAGDVYSLASEIKKIVEEVL